MNAVTNVVSTAFSEAWSWLKTPVAGSADTISVFLVTGIVIVAALLWVNIIARIRETV